MRKRKKNQIEEGGRRGAQKVEVRKGFDVCKLKTWRVEEVWWYSEMELAQKESEKAGLACSGALIGHKPQL